MQETQIAGAQFGLSIAISRLDERLTTCAPVIPISQRNARTRKPYLTNLTFRQFPVCLRINDAYPVALLLSTAVDDSNPNRGRNCSPLRDSRRVEAGGICSGERSAPRRHQGALRESVARIKGLPTQPRRREPFGEGVHCLLADWFGAAICDAPTGEIQVSQLRISNPVEAELIRKVRAAADRSSMVRDCLQPPRRTFEKRLGAKEHHRKPMVDWAEQPAHQPHVVIERSPTHHYVARDELHGLPYEAFVGREVTMRDHYALRRRSRSGGILKKCDCLLADRRGPGR